MCSCCCVILISFSMLPTSISAGAMPEDGRLSSPFGAGGTSALRGVIHLSISNRTAFSRNHRSLSRVPRSSSLTRIASCVKCGQAWAASHSSILARACGIQASIGAVVALCYLGGHQLRPRSQLFFEDMIGMLWEEEGHLLTSRSGQRERLAIGLPVDL